jgi:hypothetical protein
MDKSQLATRISSGLLRKLQLTSFALGISQEAIVTEALEIYLNTRASEVRDAIADVDSPKME